MRAAKQTQLASLRHLFYLIGYGRIVGLVDKGGCETPEKLSSSAPTRRGPCPSLVSSLVALNFPQLSVYSEPGIV